FFQGNAPNVGPDTFYYSGISMAYYRSGSTGWAALLGSCPTSLWTPDVPCGYEVDNDTIMITRYLGSAIEVTIPTTIVTGRIKMYRLRSNQNVPPRRV